MSFWKQIKSEFRAAILNFLSIFNRKKRKESVIADVASAVAAPIAPPTIEVERPSVRVGSVRNITHMLDREAVELYGRNPYV